MRIVNKSISSCPFCNIEIIHKDIKDHKAICLFGIFDCSILKCKYSGAREDFIHHVQISHEEQLLDLFNNNITKEIVKDIKEIDYFKNPDMEKVDLESKSQKCNIQ